MSKNIVFNFCKRMKAIAVFILFIGMFLVVQGYYTQSLNIEKTPKIIYRYIPSSLYDEQLSNNPSLMVSQQYKSMFENINPWPPLQSQMIEKTPLNANSIANGIQSQLSSVPTTGTPTTGAPSSGNQVITVLPTQTQLPITPTPIANSFTGVFRKNY